LAGLLWFDDDPRRDLATKIAEAAQRYQQKFGVAPDTCYVNPRAVAEQEQVVAWQGRPLRVIPSGHILAHHFWVGVEKEGSAWCAGEGGSVMSPAKAEQARRL